MNIKTLLKIVIFFVLFISILFSILIFSALQNYRISLQKSEIANSIVLKIFERKILADEYLSHPGERSKQQWYAKQKDIQETITLHEGSFKTTEEKEQVANIRIGLASSEEVFRAASSVYDQPVIATESGSLMEKKDRTSSQLGVKAQETISAARGLADSNSKYAEESLQQIIYLFSVVASTFFLMLIISFIIIWKSAKKVELGDARFHFISQATNDAVYDWDIVKNKIWFGEGMQKLFGYKANQIQNQRDWWVSHIHPEDKTKVDDLIHEMLSGKQPATFIEYRFQKANTSYADVVDKGYVVRNSQGKPIRYIGVMQDMTKERELARMKDEFVSIASHELRTPMTAIRGLVSMIFEGDFGTIPDDLMTPLTHIATSTSKLIDLVNDLLDVARIEAGRSKLILTDIPIDKFINQVISLLQPLAKTKEIELNAPSIPDSMVQGDTGKVHEILNNIIGNSLKFTDTGSITVTAEEKDELVKIFVTDTGIGISPENQEKLFGKFQQVSSQKTGRPAGTGLGLYISKALAQKMGGDVWIEKSEIGVGTTFGFSLPVANSHKADTIKKAVEQEATFHPDQK